MIGSGIEPVNSLRHCTATTATQSFGAPPTVKVTSSESVFLAALEIVSLSVF